LEGRVRLEGEGGAVEFGPGEAFVVEGGFAGTWESIGRVVKLYAILEP
ncbi:cupin, partial [Amaricoccus sp. HAR-UPW-R2A-40]